MTERLAGATRRIGSLHQLEQVVTAMRGIAASRSQQARVMLGGLRAHASVIADAIAQALALMPEEHVAAATKPRRTAVILFGGEQGFAGAFSDRMLNALGASKDVYDLFLIGTRGAALARERGIPVSWHAGMVPHAALVPGLASQIADALYDWLSDLQGCRIDLVVPTWSSAAGVIPARCSLLPFDFRRFAVRISGQPPLTTLPPALLLARLAEEYVFAELCEAALSAFVAENEARVAAMLAAKNNLQDMLSQLQTLERQIRQDEITAEVIELAGGVGARDANVWGKMR